MINAKNINYQKFPVSYNEWSNVRVEKTLDYVPNPDLT